MAGQLTNSDIITHHRFWVGVCPGLTEEMIDCIVSSIQEFAVARG